jgi:protein gp37
MDGHNGRLSGTCGKADRAFEKIQCSTKWLSVEPMLSPLHFERLDLFQWIVIGGASQSTKTPGWAPVLDWLVDLHKDAREAGLRLYYKTTCGLSDELRIKEFPWVTPQERKLPEALRYMKGL